ncbi:MAG: redox-regulated ATPase YchF [Holosporales bacterium]|jgi:GTP-binding protein YchF|nr:redox-regulated ATPase YchF [Holosporales bacterium]
MGFNCGIVGLPNVGKSTLFNALTSTASAEAANYPFCTIDPNIGRVSVPDFRLSELALIAESKVIFPAQLEVVDIAGIVKGASSGEGLGNKFLSNIRETDAIIHVVRCFDNEDVTHVSGNIDPISDIDIIETELLLADLESVEKRFSGLEKKARSGDKQSKETLEVLLAVHDVLKDGRPAIDAVIQDNQKKILRQLQLITTKPMMFVCNVSENDIISGNEYTKKVTDHANRRPVVLISAVIESEIAVLDSETEKMEFLRSIGLDSTGLSRIIRSGYDLLGLITYFTVGPNEARAWTISDGTKAPEAAGIIHTDFERGFICAETISWLNYVECGGEQKAKQTGKLRLEGKEYVVQDGDVMNFRFNV